MAKLIGCLTGTRLVVSLSPFILLHPHCVIEQEILPSLLIGLLQERDSSMINISKKILLISQSN